MADNTGKSENEAPPPPILVDSIKPCKISASATHFTSDFRFRLPKVSCSSSLKNPLHLRSLLIIVMQVVTVIALISQAVVLYRNIQWNRVLDGKTRVTFPASQTTSLDRYIAFDDSHLQNMLRRHLTMPNLGVVLLICILIFNVLSLRFEDKQGCLLSSSMFYCLFTIALALLAFGELCCNMWYTLQMYKKAGAYLLDLVPLTEDTLPYKFPEDNPISVKKNPQYFFQIMSSCDAGDVSDWHQKSELMGIWPSEFKVPSYHQLVRMGFCISPKTVYTPIAILLFLMVLSATHATLCLMIRRMSILDMTSSPSEQHEKCKDLESAALKAGGELGGTETNLQLEVKDKILL